MSIGNPEIDNRHSALGNSLSHSFPRRATSRTWNEKIRPQIHRHGLVLVFGAGVTKCSPSMISCRFPSSGKLTKSSYVNLTEGVRTILRGPAALAQAAGVDHLRASPPVLILDELHKHTKWKALLKGFYDTYGDRVRILVTGSSRLDIYRRGGDSLMGRYLLYRMHP